MIPEQVMEASKTWPKASSRGRKIRCPDCGGTGYPLGMWIYRHATHETAPCGKVVTGIGWHRGKCKACASLAVRDYFPPPRANELVYSTPPPDAETMAQVVQRICQSPAGAEE